jgi:predicted membrane protein
MNNLIKIVLSLLLFLCLLNLPYAYYQFIRFATFIGFAYLAYSANKQGSKNELFIYIALAILFQPFVKIALGRTLWNVVDVLVGLGLLLSLALPKKMEKRMKNNNAKMQNDSENQTETKSETRTKNKWLHPTDELGILEKGLEYESKTYLREKKDNETTNFTIV